MTRGDGVVAGRWKTALIGLLALVLLLALAVSRLSLDDLRAPIARQISGALDVPVEIEGALRGQLVPPRIEARDVRIGALGTVGEIEFGLDPWRLLRRIVYVTDLRASGARITLDVGGDAAIEDAGRVGDEAHTGDETRVELHVRSAVLDDANLVLRNAPAGTDTLLRVERLGLEAPAGDEPVSVSLEGAYAGIPVELSGSLGTLAALLAAAPLPLQLAGRVNEVSVRVEGRVERPADLEGLDLEIEASSPDLRALTPAESRLPALGPLTARARLNDADGSIGLEDIEVRLQASVGEVDGQLTGVVDDLKQLDEFDLTLRLESADLALLGPLLGADLPADAGPVSVSAQLVDEDEPESSDAGVESPVEISASGVLYGVDFELSGRLGSVAELLDEDSPFPVELEGRVRGADVYARGEVTAPLRGTGVDLALGVAAPDLSWLSEDARPGLVELGALVASARLVDRDGTLGLEGIRIRAGAEGAPLSLVATGDLGDLDRRDEIEFDLRLDARDLGVVGDLFGVELSPIGPVSLTGRVRGSEETFAVESLDARLDRTRFRGTASGSFAEGQRPRLDVRLESPHVRLADVGIDPRAGAVRRERATGGFRLPVELPELDARVSFTAHQISGRAGLLLDELDADVVLEPGHLGLERFEIRTVQGILNGEAHLHTSAAAPRVSLRARVAGMRIDRLLAQFEEVPSLSGTVDGVLEVESRGETLPALRADLGGDVLVVVREGSAASAYARRLELNVLRTLLSRAPLVRAQPEAFEELECGIGSFRVGSGVARVEKLWFETDQVVITGNGAVDFRSETFDLKLTPEPKRRGLVSVAAQVHVHGPFADPIFTANRTSIGTSLVRGVLSNVARPVDRLRRVVVPQSDPLLRSLQWWRDVQEREDPCTSAFEALGRLGGGAEGS